VLRLTARPMRRLLEVISRPDGSLGWYLTNKVLVPPAGDGAPMVAAASVDEHAPVGDEAMRGLEAVVRHVREHAAQALSLAGLAEVGGMAPATLERRMRRVLELSPRQLIVRTRLDEAVHRIVTTEAPLGEIAASCGFFDQAAMNRQMRDVLGVTPGSLRPGPRRGRP
jgi:AraC-like DNA-binding protein